MKFLVVGGFLGSGKTSFILRLAHHMVEERGVGKVVILENEIGAVSVDDAVLESAGYEVRGMFSGCVCCTMAGDLPVNVHNIRRNLDPDWIIMEATGVAFPKSIRDNLENTVGIRAQICCLVDAQRWMRYLKPMERLLPFQLADADVILVNKMDLTDAEMLRAVDASVRGFNEKARLEFISAQEGVSAEILDRIMDWEAEDGA